MNMKMNLISVLFLISGANSFYLNLIFFFQSSPLFSQSVEQASSEEPSPRRKSLSSGSLAVMLTFIL